MSIFSVGQNKKLARDVAVFNLLPYHTCPFRTRFCDGITVEHNGKKYKFGCYARRGRAIYSNTIQHRKQNTELAKSDKFVEVIKKELTKLYDLSIRKVRIHEAGDFFSQEYIDKWGEIVKAFPDITFLAYTRCFLYNFNRLKALPNFVLLYSIDKTTTLKPPVGPKAYIVLPGEQPPKSAVTCKHKSSKYYCGSECNFCWNLKKSKKPYDIYFNAH